MMMRRPGGMGGGGKIFRAMGSVGAKVGRLPGDVLGGGGGGGAGAGPNPKRMVAVPAPEAPRGPTSAFAPTTETVTGWHSYPCLCDYDEWEAVGCLDEEEEEEGLECGYCDRCVFAPAPSSEEAEEAVSTLQKIFAPTTISRVTEDGSGYPNKNAEDDAVTSRDPVHGDASDESKLDWMEPALQFSNSRSLRVLEHEKIIDVFYQLQTNPSIQRMVASISSDKTVWDAVMNNEVVQEIKKSFYEAETRNSEASEKRLEHEHVLKRIFNTTAAKFLELLNSITKLVDRLFHAEEQAKNSEEKNSEAFNHAVRFSLKLSVMVFIVVVLTRIRRS